jgi:hypothetical protein
MSHFRKAFGLSRMPRKTPKHLTVFNPFLPRDPLCKDPQISDGALKKSKLVVLVTSKPKSKHLFPRQLSGSLSSHLVCTNTVL